MQYKNYTIMYNVDGSYTATDNSNPLTVFNVPSLAVCFARIDN